MPPRITLMAPINPKANGGILSVLSVKSVVRDSGCGFAIKHIEREHLGETGSWESWGWRAKGYWSTCDKRPAMMPGHLLPPARRGHDVLAASCDAFFPFGPARRPRC